VVIRDADESGAMTHGTRTEAVRGASPPSLLFPSAWSPNDVLAVSVWPQWATRFVGLPEESKATCERCLMPDFAPDGHWLANGSDRSGTMEIVLRS
jgi:hypothetical protein